MEDIVLHDPEEWAGLLSAVLDAKNGRFIGIELGAGYGPWVVAAAVAARQRGISDIHLVAVEGDKEHVNWICSHLADNEIDPDKHRILHAVAGTYDGMARFPALNDPRNEWGGEAIFDGNKRPAGRLPQGAARYIELPCVSLPTLLRSFDMVDFVHLDIQGSEAEVISSSVECLNRQVRRMVVGTHGRDIERSLRKTMQRNGWSLEIDRPAEVKRKHFYSRTQLQRDGTQVWLNPRVS